MSSYIYNLSVGGDVFGELFSSEAIQKAADAAFDSVTSWLDGAAFHDIIFIALANGGNYMLHKMLEGTPFNIDYVIAKSYQGETKGALSVLYCPFDKIEGKTVVVVDDIIDTGGTIEEICRMLEENGAARIGKCVLCKREGNPIETINEPLIVPEGKWVVGCGMDHNGYGRMLDGIYYKI